MNVFLVYWHPEPRSFNAAMHQVAHSTLTGEGHAVKVTDLHAMQFDPVSSRRNFTSVQNPDFFKPQLEELYATEVGGFAPEIEAEIAKIEWCDLMIWQFPLWWFGLPAAFKGWVDRVFAMGRVYGGGRTYADGLFRGKRAMLSLTTGGPEAAFRMDGHNGDIAGILRPIQRGMLQFVGFDVLAPQIVYRPAQISEEERRAALASYAKRMMAIEAESPIEVGLY